MWYCQRLEPTKQGHEIVAGGKLQWTRDIHAKGFPWSYFAQGVLMKHAGQAQRYRQPTLEMDADEEELKEITTNDPTPRRSGCSGRWTMT